MTVIGGNLETKEIGFKVGLSGTHNSTEIDSNTGLLRLKITDTDGAGKPVYADSGTWVSDIIDLEDNFADFDKLFITNVDKGASRVAVQTRVSDNSSSWSDWVAIALDGAILSDTKRYIQIKVDFFAGFETDTFLISDFKKKEDVDLFTPNQFVETSNGLKLKRDYEFDMTVDTSWTGEGSLHRQKINRDEWLRIDKMNVLIK